MRERPFLRGVLVGLIAAALAAVAVLAPHVYAAATDDFSGPSYTVPPVTGPATHAFSITPHDTNELTHVTRGIICGTGGDLNAVLSGSGESAVVIPIAANVIHSLRLRVVKDTSTDATDCVGLY